MRPRVAVAGLNPHAGESGKLGVEEIEVIAPAIEELNSSLVIDHSSLVFIGPVSPDTVFHRAIEGEFDAVLCMYHDQGLIPLKLHAFHSGVNVTLGLPFSRTSPDHGTAFEIAGKGIARPDSMIAAINLAVELAEKRSGAKSNGSKDLLESSRLTESRSLHSLGAASVRYSCSFPRFRLLIRLRA